MLLNMNAEIQRFLVTHVHRDRYTMAVALRREFGLGREEFVAGRLRRTDLDGISHYAKA